MNILTIFTSIPKATAINGIVRAIISKLLLTTAFDILLKVFKAKLTIFLLWSIIALKNDNFSSTFPEL